MKIQFKLLEEIQNGFMQIDSALKQNDNLF